MHSPRIRVPSQSAKATMYKSWAGAKPPKSSTSKPLQDEIEKFKILVRQCEEENRNLINTLTAFNTINDIDSQTFLIDQFENELNQISKRIDKRSILINSIEKKSSRRKEAEYKNQDIFQEKTQLIAENEQLVSKALFLEKKMIAAKLKLRLNHDHRDFCRLKRQLSRLANDDDSSNEEEMEIYRNKEIIKNLKNAIEHEKTRLLQISAPPSLEEEAAEIIQKVWRGYITRKLLSQPNDQQNPTNNTQQNQSNNAQQNPVNNNANSTKTDDSPFAELDNSEINNDENENQAGNEENYDQTDNNPNEDQINNEQNDSLINNDQNDQNEDQMNNEQNDSQINNEEQNDEQINNEEIGNQEINIPSENGEGNAQTENVDAEPQVNNEENENQENNV